jgi:hypothetical protein
MTREWRNNGAEMAQIGAAEGRLAPLRHSPSQRLGGMATEHGAACRPEGVNGAVNGAEMAQPDLLPSDATPGPLDLPPGELSRRLDRVAKGKRRKRWRGNR